MTVAQIINIAKISQYLADKDVSLGALFGRRITPDTPKVLYMERKAVEFLYDLDPTDDSLTLTANYLYSLCRGYNLKAQSITGGGSVAPPVPGTAPLPKIFIVNTSSSFIQDGQSSKVITDFIGWNLLFARNGIPQSTITTESSYYTWNKTTGLFTCVGAAVDTELFALYPI